MRYEQSTNAGQSVWRATLYSAALFAVLAAPVATAATVSAPTPEGMLPHFESWIAVGIVLASVLTAILLNHSAPNVRVIGTFLAALGCFGVVAWFASILGSGVLENPKPNQAPMDSAKPMLLWIQAGVAFLAGLGLVAVANRQRKSNATLNLSARNESDRYGRVSRVLHWTTAILFISMIPMGIFASMIPEDVWYRTEYNMVHKTIGLIIFLLLIARLLWNRMSRRPMLSASLKPMEHKLAHGAHVALYVLMFAVPLSGYVMTSLHGYPSFFFGIELQPFLAESDAYVVWGLFHKYILQYLVYLILGAHILGALKHQLIDKHDDAFKRMVS